ncbi:MAG: hypothetical protein R3C01_17205 [Planctomycetaceae bacterium]
MPRAILISTGLLAAASLLFCTLSYEPVERFLAALTADGEIASFTPERHIRLRVAMALIGTLLLFAAVGMWRSPEGVVRHWGNFVHGGRRFWGKLRQRIVRDWWLLLGYGGLALWLRLPYLDQPMRYDESYTWLEYASHPFYEAISMYWDPNNHLCHTLQVHLSVKLFGLSPMVLRLPALFAGVMLAMVAAIAVRPCGVFASLAAGLWIASHPMLIEYSTTSRGYMMQALLCVVLLRLTWTMTRQRDLFLWFCWGLTASVAMWTIPTSLYFVVAASVALLWSRRTLSGPHLKEMAIGLGVTGLATLLLYLPVLVYTGPFAVTHNPFVRPLPLSDWLVRWPAALRSDAEFLLRDLPWSVVGLLLILLLVGLTMSIDRLRLRLFSASLLIASGLTLIQRVHPPSRVWIYLIPQFLMLAAIGFAEILNRIRHRKMRYFVGLILLLVVEIVPLQMSVKSQSILYSNEGGIFRDAPMAAHVVMTHGRPDEPILATCPSHAPVVFYAITRESTQGKPSANREFPAHWDNRPSPSSLLLVVNSLYGDTLEKLFDEYQFSDAWRRGKVEVLATFPTGSVVRITRDYSTSAHDEATEEVPMLD